MLNFLVMSIGLYLFLLTFHGELETLRYLLNLLMKIASMKDFL